MTDVLSKVAVAIAEIVNEKGQEMASKYEAQAPVIPWRAFEREAKAAIEATRESVYQTIDRFQDIIGWQEGESRNRLVCEIRDKVDATLKGEK